jgi:hypothetical protein
MALNLPEEILSLFNNSLDLKQISDEVMGIISKVYHNEKLAEDELDMLVNPTEAAALLSAKYRRTIRHRYIKEITRAVKNPTTGHITPARLTHDRIAGKTYLYRARNVLNVRLRQKSNMSIAKDSIANECITCDVKTLEAALPRA